MILHSKLTAKIKMVLKYRDNKTMNTIKSHKHVSTEEDLIETEERYEGENKKWKVEHHRR